MTAKQSPPEPLWTPADVAEYFGFTVDTLGQMRYTGTGPPFIKMGHQVRYRRADVENWLSDRTRTSTGAEVAR